MSVFRPVNKELYQVIHNVSEESVSVVVSRTPMSFGSFESKSPIPQPNKEMKPKIVKVIKREKQKEKKFWSVEEKVFAIQKAEMIGISKALRWLQNEYPQVYGDLSPSTIQYWVSKCKHLIHN